jgi:hypothetical protein
VKKAKFNYLLKKIYTLATVNSEIKNGAAMITMLDNEKTAMEIPNSINSK